MSGIGDRWTWRRGDFVIVPPESDEQRFAAFAEPFELKAGQDIFYDGGGHPVMIAPSWTEGLDRYAAAELARAARAIVDPDEIRNLWKHCDGERLWTRRYLRSEGQIGIGVDVNRAGWCFATSEDPGFDIDELRVGELAWPGGRGGSDHFAAD